MLMITRYRHVRGPDDSELSPMLYGSESKDLPLML